MIAGTLFLGSCASNSSSSEGKEAKIEEVTSTLDNVNEINFKNKKNVLLDVRTPEEFAEGKKSKFRRRDSEIRYKKELFHLL